MKICSNCRVTYADKEILCWNCYDYLEPATECVVCKEWTEESERDLCAECKREIEEAFTEFLARFDMAQVRHLDDTLDGNSLLDIYLK